MSLSISVLLQVVASFDHVPIVEVIHQKVDPLQFATSIFLFIGEERNQVVYDGLNVGQVAFDAVDVHTHSSYSLPQTAPVSAVSTGCDPALVSVALTGNGS